MQSNIHLPGPEEHPAWLKNRRRQLQRLLGGPAYEGPLRASSLKRRENNQRIEEQVVYEGEPGEHIPATLLIPKEQGLPLPGIICLHAQGANRSKGRIELTTAEAIGTELCHRGYVVLAPELVGYEERADLNEDTEQGRLLLQGWSLSAKTVWEIKRAIDFLTTRPEVEKNRIGILGIGKGGLSAWLTAAIDARLTTIAICWGASTYAAIIRENISLGPKGWVPGLLNWGDAPEVCNLIAPRPLFLCGAQLDPLFPPDGFEEIHWRVRQLYLRLKADDMISRYLIAGEPKFDTEVRARLTNWFDKWL